jgi:hypothetical protein
MVRDQPQAKTKKKTPKKQTNKQNYPKVTKAEEH